MEIYIMAILFMGITLFVRRKEAFIFRWQPQRSTWLAIGTGLLAFAFSAGILLFPETPQIQRFIHYMFIYLLCGFIIPWAVNLFVDQKALSGMGIKKEKWLLSLLVGIGISLFMSMAILFQADFSQMDWGKFAKASFVLSGAGGLFELFLYYSFIHTRLEKAFGVIPAIVLSAFLYVLWHTGTQIPLEADPVAAYFKLFAVGIMYQSVFSLTRNVLIIWPFFHWSGVMIDFVINISELDAPAQNLPWAIAFLVAMIISGIILYLIKKSKQME